MKHKEMDQPRDVPADHLYDANEHLGDGDNS